MDAIPLTPNGKVDRTVLLSQLEAIAVVSPPEISVNPLQAELQGMWQSLLKQPVGIQDSFFALGGHSLMAMQLQSQVQSRYAVEIPLVDFLTQPTVEHLADLIQSSQPLDQAFPSIPPVDHSQPQPLSIDQQRIWLLHQLHPIGAAYHITVAQRIHGPLDVAALDQCLQILVQRHGVLRTTFEIHHQHPRQVLRDKMAIALDLQDGLAVDQSLEQTLQDYAAQPFDLANGPLVRVLILQQQADETVLALSRSPFDCRCLVRGNFGAGTESLVPSNGSRGSDPLAFLAN